MSDFKSNGDILDFVDATTAAAQLGRLDFVSSLLAIVSIILVIAGVIAFLNFRALARKQAKEEAIKIATEIAEKTTVKYLQENLSKLIEANRNLMAGSSEQDADIVDGYLDKKEEDN